MNLVDISNTDSPSNQEGSAPSETEKLHKILAELDKVRRQNRLQQEYSQTYEQGNCQRNPQGEIIGGGPYPWQVDFHNHGKKCDERMLMCANQIGKSRSAGAEVACHLTGWYPKWWKGKRFSQPVKVLVCGVTNEELRNICQAQLLGDILDDREADGTGWIPKEKIGKPKFRQCGVSNVVDTIKIEHSGGGWSTVTFKSYEQGVSKFQGVQFDVAWMDEEPLDGDVFSEIQTRMMVKKGILMFTRTPLYGMTDMVRHFVDGGKDIVYVMAGLDEAPHINEETKNKYLSRWPEHERETRSKGIPMLGEGGIYPVQDDWILCDAFELPSHYRRIVGIDFGINHPFVAVWIAYDADTDCIYVYDVFSQSGTTPPEHCQAIQSRGGWIPVSWPHDGAMREKGSGITLAQFYRDHNLNMCHMSARFDDDRGGGQSTERIVMEMLERMRTGRLKIFSHLVDWMSQKRMYHRKDGKIVRKADDIMSATNYAVMMLRYAVNTAEGKFTQPVMADDGYNSLESFSEQSYSL